MIRWLSLVFVLLAAAVVYFRVSAPKVDARGGKVASAHPGDAAPDEWQGDDERLGPDPMPKLATRSLSSGLIEKGQWRGKPALADLNGDGLLDIVCAVRRWDRSTAGDGIHVFLHERSGKWVEQNHGLRRDLGYGGSDVADINGDGKPDIAFSAHDRTPHLFLNLLETQGQSTWVETTEGLDIDSICADVALGDFDGDGKADLVSLGQFPKTGGMLLFRGNGEGGFARKAELMPKRNFGARVRLVDLDGDGKREIVAATDRGPRVWRAGPDGNPQEMSQGLSASTIGGSDFTIDAADLDGDGKKELVVGGMPHAGHASLRIFKHDGKAWQPWGSGLPEDDPTYDLVVAHFGAKDEPFIVTAGQRGIALIKQVAPGKFAPLGRLADSQGALGVCCGDLTGDGVDEVVYVGFRGVRVLQVEPGALHAEGKPTK